MKLLVFVLCIACVIYVGALSAAVLARDLGRIAQQERARRDSLPMSERGAKSFTDAHLESYAWQRRPAKLGAREASPPSQRDLDMAKAQAFWQRQKMDHDRELARIEARIRRLQSRLAQRESVARRKGWRRDDPTITLIQDSLESLREEREKLDLEFRERARKAGAFPGWIR